MNKPDELNVHKLSLNEKRALDDKLIMECIEHWVANYVAAIQGKDFHITGVHCSLCQVYAASAPIGRPCSGCPVKDKVHKANCHGTPWGAVKEAKELCERGGGSKEALVKAVENELLFLKSLI
jgi:hypothetical protein